MMTNTRLIPRTESAYETPLLIKSILDQTTKYNPHREIVYRDLFRMNYTEFNKRVRRLANLMAEVGIRPGDMVGVMDWDSHRYLECFFGIPCYGAILHTINVRLSPAQILYTINHAEDQILLVHEDFFPIIEAIQAQFTTVKQIIIISDQVYSDQSENRSHSSFAVVGEYESLLKKQSDLYQFEEFDENTWATTFYTTGTTGDPKGVYFSHRQLFMHTMGLVAYFCGFQAFPYTEKDVYMPITPLFHVHAWGFPLVASMLNNKQVYPGRYEPEMLLKLLITEKVTISHCVPTILNMLVHSPQAQSVDLHNWKVIIGGSALTAGLAKDAMDLGINVISGYGMSETAPVLTVAHLSELEKELPVSDQIQLRTKAGRIAPFVTLKIQDEFGNDLPHDGMAMGEIVAQSPWLTQGYFKDSENGKALWKDGWLHTGDIGTISPTNYVTILDRAKDIIKTGGEWICTLDIENIISKIEGVKEVAVVGVTDQKWGERPYAMVVIKEENKDFLDQPSLHESIRKMVLAAGMNKWFIPDHLELVDEIPKTSVGKIDKKKIRANLRAKDRD